MRQYAPKLSTHNDSPLHDIEASYQVYQEKGNEMNRNMLQNYHSNYKNAIGTRDDRKLWSMIDWSGNDNVKPPTNHPSVYALPGLYEPIQEESIDTLQSNITISITDDPITLAEVYDASNQMKKGEYDYPISVLKVNTTTQYLF